jgi:hypothetical protein
MNDTVFRGVSLPIFFPPAKDVTGAVIDLTGATIACAAQLATGGAEVAAQVASVTSGPDGLAQGEFSAAQTAAFTLGANYRYDGIATLPSGEVVALGRGAFLVSDLASTP